MAYTFRVGINGCILPVVQNTWTIKCTNVSQIHVEIKFLYYLSLFYGLAQNWLWLTFIGYLNNLYRVGCIKYIFLDSLQLKFIDIFTLHNFKENKITRYHY